MTNLPSSRDFTLAPGDPVPSTLLNTLQDQIIGDKHSSRVLMFPPIRFQATAGSGNVTFTGSNGAAGGAWTTNAGPAGAWEVETSLLVPAGTSIDKIEAFLKTPSVISPASDSYVVRLLSRTLTVGAPVANQVDLGSVYDGSTFTHLPPNLESIQLAGLPVLALVNTVYVLHFKLFQSAALGTVASFYGMGVTLSRI